MDELILFPICMHFSFFYLIELAETSSTTLNKNGKKNIISSNSYLTENASDICTFSMMLPVALLYLDFIVVLILKVNLFRLLIMNGCFILLNAVVLLLMMI